MQVGTESSPPSGRLRGHQGRCAPKVAKGAGVILSPPHRVRFFRKKMAMATVFSIRKL